MTEIRPSRAIYLFYGIATVLGAAMICWQAAVLQKQEASFHWPVATGTILQSTRTYVSGSDSHYRADVFYSYKVDGTRYVSHQISLWSADLSSYDTQGFVASHPEGSETTVYYDPKHPGNAVLIPGADEKENEFVMAMGGLAIIGSIGGIFRRLKRQPRLYALLNAPDAQTRTIELRKSDIESGINYFVTNVLVAGGFLMAGVVFLLVPFLSAPTFLLEAPARHSNSWQLFAGVGSLAGCAIFLARGMRQSRGAQCPLCGNMLNKKVFTTAKCDECGTRIIFKDVNLPSGEAAPRTKSFNRPVTIRGFQKDRFIEVAGFMAFPVLFVWMLIGSNKQIDIGIAFLFTIILLGIGALYYFYPEGSNRYGGARHPHKKASDAVENPTEAGPYLLDFTIILSAPVVLLSFLLYLVWQHHVLDTRGLIAVVIGFPASIGIVSYICSLRFTHAKKINVPKPPAFVPLTLLALWIVGTFISVVFLVCLIYRLKSAG